MAARPLSRRSILRGAAGTCLSLPLMEAMQAGGKSVYAATPPKRIVVFATTHGTFPERFWPYAPGGQPFPATKRETKGFRTGTTAMDTTDHGFHWIIEPLAKHKRDLVFVEGLDNYDGNLAHDGLNVMLNQWRKDSAGATNGSSVDQVIAKHVGTASKIASLQLGVNTGENKYYTRPSWISEGVSAPPQNDPKRVFDQVFGDLAVDPMLLERLRAEQKSILDGATAQIADLQRRVSPEDKLKLGNYLDSIRAFEQRLDPAAAGGGGGCSKPAAPSLPSIAGDASMPGVLKAQLDLLVMALTCDVTRAVTVLYGNEGGGFSFPHLGIDEEVHFGIGHQFESSDGTAREQVTKINTWYAEQFAGLIDRMKAVPEGDGTLLDHTLLLWMIPIPTGVPHTNLNVPVVIAGSGGGAIRTGRHVRYARDTARSLADLHVTLLHAFGIDAKTFGHTTVNHAPLDDLLA